MGNLKNNGFTFIDFIYINEHEIAKYQPLAGSFAVIKCDHKYLLCYNNWREQWELPAGQREDNETPKECAMRELYEETGQIVTNLEFKGLMKVENTTNRKIKYNPVYFSTINKLQPFIANEETSEIRLWSRDEQIGSVDRVDIKLLDYV